MNTAEAFLVTLAIVSWAFGVAVAKGFCLSALAIFFPPAAWVLLAKWILERFT